MNKTQLLEYRNLLVQKIDEAQAVLVGVGEEFNESFEDIERFPRLRGALDEVDANESLEWTVPYLEKLYLCEHSDGKLIEAYRGLYKLIKDKNYFVITTCIDENIKKAGFDEDKIVEPCGSYRQLQCSQRCSADLYLPDKFLQSVNQAIADNTGLDVVEQPVCPLCGAKLVFNNILCESRYVEEGYKPQWEKYTKWLQLTLNRRLCVLELGVGVNMPDIIRFPFEKVAFYNQKADFFRINETLYQMTEDLGDKGVSIAINSVDFLQGCYLSDRE